MRFITRDKFTSVHMAENKTYRTLVPHPRPILMQKKERKK